MESCVDTYGNSYPSFSDAKIKDDHFSYDLKFGEISCLNQCRNDRCDTWIENLIDNFPTKIEFVFFDSKNKIEIIKRNITNDYITLTSENRNSKNIPDSMMFQTFKINDTNKNKIVSNICQFLKSN